VDLDGDTEPRVGGCVTDLRAAVEARIVARAVGVARRDEAEVRMRPDQALRRRCFLDVERLAFEDRLIDRDHRGVGEVVFVGEVGPAAHHRFGERTVVELGRPVANHHLPDDVRLFGRVRVLDAKQRSVHPSVNLFPQRRLAGTVKAPNVGTEC
jgi:hypothetical protein